MQTKTLRMRTHKCSSLADENKNKKRMICYEWLWLDSGFVNSMWEMKITEFKMAARSFHTQFSGDFSCLFAKKKMSDFRTSDEVSASGFYKYTFWIKDIRGWRILSVTFCFLDMWFFILFCVMQSQNTFSLASSWELLWIHRSWFICWRIFFFRKVLRNCIWFVNILYRKRKEKYRVASRTHLSQLSSQCRTFRLSITR